MTDTTRIDVITDLAEVPGWVDMQGVYLAHACERHHAATGQWVDPEDELRKTVDKIGDFMGSKGRFIAARDSDDMLLGMVLLYRLANGKAEVKRLYVHPDARGRGLARQLMARLEAQARGMGCPALYLDTTVGLHESIALYRTLGFTDADFDPGSVQDPDIAQHLVFLEKPL